MSHEQVNTNKSKFYSVIDASFRVQVPKNHPEAVQRDWSTKDGKSGTKYERVVQALFGAVEAITFVDGEYGKNLNITLDADEDGFNPVISIKADSREGESVLKALPNMKPGVEYRFMPYSFEDTGKRGISIASRDEDGKFTIKVLNFFTEKDGDGWKNVNGYPDPTDEDKTDWPFYYKKANKFLVKYAEEHVLPKFEGVSQVKSEGFEYPEEINPEDIPF